MKKKILIAAIVILSMAILMFVEYRYIMENICPYRGEGGIVYLEIFGQYDEYYAEAIGE